MQEMMRGGDNGTLSVTSTPNHNAAVTPIDFPLERLDRKGVSAKDAKFANLPTPSKELDFADDISIASSTASASGGKGKKNKKKGKLERERKTKFDEDFEEFEKELALENSETLRKEEKERKAEIAKADVEKVVLVDTVNTAMWLTSGGINDTTRPYSYSEAISVFETYQKKRVVLNARKIVMGAEADSTIDVLRQLSTNSEVQPLSGKTGALLLAILTSLGFVDIDTLNSGNTGNTGNTGSSIKCTSSCRKLVHHYDDIAENMFEKENAGAGLQYLSSGALNALESVFLSVNFSDRHALQVSLSLRYRG